MASNPLPLKKSSSYREVAVKSKKLRLSRWLTLQVMPSQDSLNYYGITVSKKVGNSVMRNKLKRWVRNCVRTENWPQKFNSCTIVFVFKSQADPTFFSKLEYQEFKKIYSALES